MNRPSNFGFSSILLAFVMMCIITFSTLALLTANSDYRLSQKVAEKNTAYFQAEKNACKTLFQVDQALSSVYKNASTRQEYFQNASSIVSDIVEGSWETEASDSDTCKTNDSQNQIYTFNVPISASQNLKVSFELLFPESQSENFYTITQWQSVHTGTSFSPEEESLHLIGAD